jgi:peptide/nickel transport system ATP-binding protein
VEVGDPDALFAGAAHPYTRALVSALPIADPATERRRQRVILRGDIPSPITPPSGCRFHTRCWLYEQLGRPDRCRDEAPILQPVAPGRQTACHFHDQLHASPVGRVDTRLEVRRGHPTAADGDPA